jgi:hypothetical protein
MEQPIQTFVGMDSNGQSVVLQVWREMRSVDGSLEPGMTRIATRDGRSVERKHRGFYEITESRELIVSDWPDAP